METIQNAPLLKVEGLTKNFTTGNGTVRAVDNVSFEVPKGAIMGLVGESGSGKTTIGRSLLRLIEPSGGKAIFEGQDLFALREREMRKWRSRLQMVFQDPYSSLNPRLRTGQIIGEALSTHGLAEGAARQKRIAELLTMVGLRPEFADRYPHEFSGGQRQRIGIARALAVKPSFIVADEPVSALDVSVQAQVLNLFQELRKNLGLTILFISHDLAVVEYLCDFVTVLYLGRVMESGPSSKVFSSPTHPYTKALLSASPVPDPQVKGQRIMLKGDIPSPLNPPTGCVFRTRCIHAVAACAVQVPQLEPVESGEAQDTDSRHVVACTRRGQI
ncbi:peptide ABC transporter ATP-binding protein [Pandoraea horticolens]|uniref:Peptide ABC transporter ATP-binding protein n=1 Tax=Pandoraea horticolens TaxID=2508298 RepID=A0A5E4X910_9BURK|nr:ABC transporter ATP-binding protein [Pandoraea horticolens]VVE32891.1 peptide ABC transporter ATP-binding protein [Pandoraea horticolens]